jgi:hypothetical protein
VARGERLRRDDRVDPNQSIQNFRSGTSASSLMRSLFENDGTVSTAILQYVSMAKSHWRVEAYEASTNEFSREGLMAAETVVAGMDTLWNYTRGYQDKRSLDEIVETLLLEALQTGGVGLELVLDRELFPSELVTVPYDQLEWRSNGRGGRYPVQRVSGGLEAELNIPNFFVAEMAKSADRLMTLPVMVAGVKRLIAYESFIEDMQRVVRRSGGPRLLVSLDYDRVRAAAPADIAGDAAKLETYLETVRGGVETLLSGLEPEDALVYYNLAEVDSMSTTGEKRDYKELLAELSGLAASALKTNPSMMGMRMAGGSQNVASTEAMLALKLAGMFQGPVKTVLSRALTLAVRLMGVDAYVKFKFDPVDLRPESELEAHKSMRQSRVLELLSYGRVTDDEAQTLLGLGSLPASAETLSGTGFYKSKEPDTLPASGTNARNAAVKPDTPSSAGGRDNVQRV